MTNCCSGPRLQRVEPAAQRGWELIRETGAFEPDLFLALIETLEIRTTKKQIRDSIAASKELLEGVMRGVLRDYGYTERRSRH